MSGQEYRTNKGEGEDDRSSATYGDVSKALVLAQQMYSTHEGLVYLHNRKVEAVERILEVTGDNVLGIFSTGYPNYLIPEIEIPTRGTALQPSEFTPIAEVVNYVGATLSRAETHDASERWPCSDCYRHLGLKSLRPSGYECNATPSPLYLFASLPDLDLYMVVDETDDIYQITREMEAAGLNGAENQMDLAIQQFPTVLNVDPIFILKQDFLQGLQQIDVNSEEWFRLYLPALKLHGDIVPGRIHFGIDFASQLSPHFFRDKHLAAAYHRVRNRFAMNQPMDSIVEQMKSTANKDRGVYVRQGRFVGENPQVEAALRGRIFSYRERGIMPLEGSRYILVSHPHPRALYELFEHASKDPQKIILDEALLPLIGAYAPSVIIDMNNILGSDLPHLKENIYVERMVQSSVQFGALDNMVIEGNATVPRVLNRFKRMMTIFDELRLSNKALKDSSDRFERGEITLSQAVVHLKTEILGLFSHYQRKLIGYTQYERSSHNYPFEAAVKDLFGQRLKNIFLYGSSTEGRKGNDYDLLVVVDTLTQETYKEIEDSHFTLNQGCDREVHMMVIPQDYLEAFLSTHDVLFENLELVSGESAMIPQFEEDEALYMAYPADKIPNLIKSTMAAFHDPLTDRSKPPHVFHGHFKVARFVIDAYRKLYEPILGSDFFDQLHSQYPKQVLQRNVTVEDARVMRVRAIANIFEIANAVKVAVDEQNQAGLRNRNNISSTPLYESSA